MDFSITPQLQQAFDFVESTGVNLFLTGKAGTGKTTFLHTLKKTTSKRMVVVAPTGVAAINAGGVTIHSFFQLSFGPQLPANTNFKSARGADERFRLQRFSRDKINIIKSLDLLVIDEVSMVRADLLDGIDGVLRRFKNRAKPFGGVQLLMIGDLQQLAPIAKEDEWTILRNYYDTVFFFSSNALKQTSYISIELKHIFRQSDKVFIDLLNKVRNNELDHESIVLLNNRYIPNFSPNDSEGYITLTTHNYQAQSINNAKLGALKTKPETMHAIIQGDFPEHAYPTNKELILKEGAQVMFVKNDPSYEKLFYNGKIGTLQSIDEDILYVECPGDPAPIAVTPLEWENTNYTIDHITKEIKESITGTFAQYPLKLAWAITIHKSQGLTFERAIIDAQSAFAHGQVYVALSRCKSLEGLVLNSSIASKAIINDNTVLHFNKDVENNPPTQDQLSTAQRAYQKDLLLELFNFSVIYRQLGYLQKIIFENSSSFHPELKEKFTQFNLAFKVEIQSVSDKFAQQILKIINEENMVEESRLLQERVIKAVTYFVPKLETNILQGLYGLNTETDSKELNTRTKEQLDKISKEINEKIMCLKDSNGGFNVNNYLCVRAKASIEPFIKQKTGKEKMDISYSANPEMFNRLKSWRDKTAKSQGIKIYRVLRQNTIVEIADLLPVTKDSLKAVKGMGAKKISSFGKELIEMVVDYRKEKGLPAPEVVVFEDDVSPQKKKSPNSKLVTLELFLSGKSVEQVAAERQMAISTIYSHLAILVGEGHISVEKVVPQDKIETISTYFLKADNYQLSVAKDALGESFSYPELRCVLNHLKFNGKILDQSKDTELVNLIK